MRKTICITGGTDGLGKATAEALSKKHTVIIIGRDSQKTKKIATVLGCDFFLADLSKKTDIQKCVKSILKKYQTIDCLINNAGLWIEGPLEKNDPDKIEEVIHVNTTGLILFTQGLLSRMKENKKGRIVNVISERGLYGRAERSVYAASKWAITGFTKCLQMELAPFKISVTGFYPGPIHTGFFDKLKVGDRDVKGHMEVSDVVPALEFIVNAPDYLTIPELGIKMTDR